jgi:hypothetical protein
VESFEEATFLLQAVIVSKIIMETRQFWLAKLTIDGGHMEI